MVKSVLRHSARENFSAAIPCVMAQNGNAVRFCYHLLLRLRKARRREEGRCTAFSNENGNISPEKRAPPKCKSSSSSSRVVTQSEKPTMYGVGVARVGCCSCFVRICEYRAACVNYEGILDKRTRCTYDETWIPRTRRLTLSSFPRCVS